MSHSHPVIRQQIKPEQPKQEEPKQPEPKPIEAPVVVQAKEKATVIKPATKAKEDRSFDNITAVVVNYRTKHLIETAVTSFRKFYPTISLVIVDNGSGDESREWIKKQKGDHTRVVLKRKNCGHGPALHREFSRATTQFMFTFDSDVEFLRGGLIEGMLAQIGDAYAIGWRRWVNQDGVAVDEKRPFDKSMYCPYIHPYCALYNRDIYFTLRPFVNNGAPAVFNMRDAKIAGIDVKPFHLEPYVKHLVAGTRRMWNGHWYPKDKKQINEWVKDSQYPI